MAETWIDLPQAVDRLAIAQGLDAIAARSALLDLINADGIATRVKLMQGVRFDGTPDLDEPLNSTYWRDLSDLTGDWWETGIAEFGNKYAYRGIQVREADLAAQMGDFGASPPTATTAQPTPYTGEKRGPKGKWDWEAAFAYLIALANSMDGLHPDGDHKIDTPHLTKLLADWFSRNHIDGNHPSDSLLRTKAGVIRAALDAIKPS
jgi:hypothetical protein